MILFGLMIKLRVEYFAVFREQSGCDNEEILTELESVKQVFEFLSDKYNFSDSIKNCKVAINGNLVDWDYLIRENDTVFFFPPVAGG